MSDRDECAGAGGHAFISIERRGRSSGGGEQATTVSYLLPWKPEAEAIERTRRMCALEGELPAPWEYTADELVVRDMYRKGETGRLGALPGLPGRLYLARN